MTRREKLRMKLLTDERLWDYICMHTDIGKCDECPIHEICDKNKVEREEEFKAWLDEEGDI